MATPTFVNKEALADPNYNPVFNPRALKLYKLMTPGPGQQDSSTDLASFKAQFLSLPTKNIFSQAVANPVKCHTGSSKSQFDELQSYFPVIRAQLPTSDRATWDAAISGISSDLTTSGNAMDNLDDHTDRIIANLPTLGSVAQAQMGLDTVANALANPCSGLSNFMGSIMSGADSIAGQVSGIMDSLVSQVQNWAQVEIGPVLQMTSTITNAISQVSNLTGQISSLIDSEVNAFAGAFLNQARMGLADFMASMKPDPCMANTLVGLATDAASSILGGL